MTERIKEEYVITTRYGRRYAPTKSTLKVPVDDEEWFGELMDLIKIAFVYGDTTSVSIRRLKKKGEQKQ